MRGWVDSRIRHCLPRLIQRRFQTEGAFAGALPTPDHQAYPLDHDEEAIEPERVFEKERLHGVTARGVNGVTARGVIGVTGLGVIGATARSVMG